MGRDKSDFDTQDEEEQAISGAGTTSTYPPAPAYSGKAILTYTYTTAWNNQSSKMGLFGQSKEVSPLPGPERNTVGCESLMTVRKRSISYRIHSLN